MTDETSFIWEGYDSEESEKTMLVVDALSELYAHERYDDFLVSATNLISKEFGLTFVGLYLTDEPQKQAMFQAGSGVAGKLFLKRNHSVSLSCDVRDVDGLVSESINKNAICVTGATLIEGFFYSTLTFDPKSESIPPFKFKEVYAMSAAPLPNTRLVIVLPLRTREKVIGTLKIEHSESYLDIRSAGKQVLPVADRLAFICESHFKTHR